MVINLTADEVRDKLDELGIEPRHDDYERMAEYIGLVGYYSKDLPEEQSIAENMGKWLEWEDDSYYGQHASPAEFAQYYYENYHDGSIPDWVTVDWEETFRRNLRHDFYMTDSGYVWADVY